MANIKISELNELTAKEYTDYIPIVDTSADETKKISVENLIPSNVNLIAVSDTAPETYETGDKYFNTETNKIYTATSSGWANAEDPIENILYIVLEEQTTYVYDNYTESMISVGGGAGGSGGDTTPIGTIEAYSGSTAPNGYLLCDGSAVSRTTYSDLFSVIGTTYGNGDGSTTFNLPDLKGRVIVMQDANDTDFDTLGETGGDKNLQQHSHTLIVGDGNIVAGGEGGMHASIALDPLGGYRVYTNPTTETAGTGNSGNLQPYIVLNYIIKANKIAEVPTTAQVVNTHSDSTEDTYACDYINKLVKTGKTLWTGSFTEGTITVPGLSNYSLLAISLDGGIICIGNSTWGIGGIGAYGSYNIQIYGYRFNPSGDTLTIDNVNKGGSDGTQNVPVVAIRGIY